MTAASPFDRPARTVALEWCRTNAPDLRLQHSDDASGARFTYAGHVVELETVGADHRDAIVQQAFETIRQLQGDPVRRAGAYGQGVELEQQIVAARYRGQHLQADALERELLQLRAGAPAHRPVQRVAHEGVISQTNGRTRWTW